jgi:hypothetical protein
MMMKIVCFLLWLNNISVIAEKDYNVYSWGQNPNIKDKMYWKDSPNVLEDLEQFSALYIKVHGCAWSEYGLGTTYDDDGENHDGDGNWYMSRVQTFRANAAFSLYGTLREGGSFGGGCKKKTYINSFFTYKGADTIVKLLDLGVSAFPDASYGSNYCYSYYEEGDNNKNDRNNNNNHRDLKSGDNNKNNQNKMTTTMGCAADGSFANAKFYGEDCDGNYFLNITDDLDDYNNAMDKVSCQQIWNYNKDFKQSSNSNGRRNLGQHFNDDAIPSTYGSIAEKLLYTSFACDLDLYPDACPDPYGLKTKYTDAIKSAANGKRVRTKSKSNAARNFNIAWQKPVLVVSWMMLILSVVLSVYTYWLKNRKYALREGGGARALAAMAWSDMKGTVVKNTVKVLGPRKGETGSLQTSKKKKKSSRSSKSGEILRKKEKGSTSVCNALDYKAMLGTEEHISPQGSLKNNSMPFDERVNTDLAQVNANLDDDFSTSVIQGERYAVDGQGDNPGIV